ncbi:MAG: hypothetical protein GTO18_01725 [Anaerolineales bacterium]|nr:hypothetical protein [Anaerolineales bacterium]
MFDWEFFVEEGAQMTIEELKVSLRRFSQMHSYYLRMISSDPDNASTYKILVDHYQRQYIAIGERLQELGQRVEMSVAV